MARYIDADKLIEHIKDLPTWRETLGIGWRSTKYPNGMFDCEDIINSIDNAPTADVAEVKWIDINERLPQENVRVLVYLDETLYNYTHIDTDRIKKEKWVRWGKAVTHWMPLPKPPNSAKMEGGKEE